MKTAEESRDLRKGQQQTAEDVGSPLGVKESPAPPAQAPPTFGDLERSKTDPLSVLSDHLAESVADRVAARLVDLQPEPLKTERGKLALSKAEAAEALGMSVDHLERHVLGDLRVVRSGRLRLIPLAELEAWLDRSASRTLAGARRRTRRKARMTSGFQTSPKVGHLAHSDDTERHE